MSVTSQAAHTLRVSLKSKPKFRNLGRHTSKAHVTSTQTLFVTVQTTLCVCVLSHLGVCDPVDCCPPGFSVYGIFQARILYGLIFPFLGDLPDPRIEYMPPLYPELQADPLPSEPPGKSG